MDKSKKIFRHPMVLTGLLIILVFALFVHANLSEGVPLDGYLLGFIAFVAFCSCLFMVFRTKWEDWNLFGSSLFYHFLAVALLYGMVVFYDYNSHVGYYLHVLNLTRAALFVSGSGVFIAIIHDWYQDVKISRNTRAEHKLPKENPDGNESI